MKSYIRGTVAAVMLMLGAISLWADPVLNIPDAEKTHVGIYIEELRSGNVLVDINSTDLFVPASVMKSVTSATVLSEIEPAGRFVTPVDMVGQVKDGVLQGNIMVLTIGDPTIESAHFPGNLGFADSVACALKERGITAIKGTVIIDESNFVDATVPHGWERADLSTYYGTLFRSANYRGNSSGKRAVSDPAAVMRREIMEAIGKAGIEIGTEKVKADDGEVTTVYVHSSPRVDEILRSLMVRSDNMMAEGMLRTISAGNTRQKAISAELDLWKRRGIDMEGIAIYDGSGLSRSDRLTPRFVASLYRWMYNDGMRRAYASLFPRAGLDGTMRNFLKGTRLEGRLAMKTGSMSGVQGFGGYLLDEKGNPTHTVVVFVNDFTCDRSRLKTEIGNFLLENLP